MNMHYASQHMTKLSGDVHLNRHGGMTVVLGFTTCCKAYDTFQTNSQAVHT